jgi:hypothetical protein
MKMMRVFKFQIFMRFRSNVRDETLKSVKNTKNRDKVSDIIDN